MVNPQLPASAVVTPCKGDGVSAPSQNTWASKWVCTSMNPGETNLPVASIVWTASSVISPILTMRSPLMPTSARRRAAPDAVDDLAALDDYVKHWIPSSQASLQ